MPRILSGTSKTLKNSKPLIRNTKKKTTTAAMAAGMLLTGTGVPANAYILTVDSATQVTISQNCTASASVTLTAATRWYQYKLMPATTEQAVTLIGQQGVNAFVATTVKGNNLTLSINKTQQTPLRASLQCMYLRNQEWPASTSANLATLGLSALSVATDKYGPADWSMSFGGVQSPDAQSFTLSYNRNLGSKQVGDYYMGPQSNYAQVSTVTAQADLYWASLDQLLTFFGYSTSTSVPVGFLKTLMTTAVLLDFTPPVGADGIVNGLQVVMPVCTIHNLTKDLPETGPIMQNISLQPRQDPANSFVDHYILWKTTETYSALTTQQPEIQNVPTDQFWNYNNVGSTVKAASSPTTTSIVATATAFLSAVDSTYNGLLMQFTSCVNKGLQRTISAYTGSTNTFTVAAFPAAPAVGDSFIVINGYSL
jgi:hypothetical protein